MARMSIDDKFLRDPRVTRLAARLACSRREARGWLLEVFAVCYDLETDVLSVADIDAAADRVGFADEMFAVDLLVVDRHGLRVRGAKKRIEYLNHKVEAGRIGGLNSGLSRRQSSKQNTKQTRSSGEADPPARGNLPDPVPDPVPDLLPDPVPDQREREDLVAPRAARRKPGRQSRHSASPTELAIVTRVLERLGEHSGVAYGGAAQHVKLIVGRLREGLTEWQLRAVIAHVVDAKAEGGLGWKSDEKMRQYLRPETLFGPESIARYLDAACTRYRDLIAQHEPQPSLTLDGETP